MNVKDAVVIRTREICLEKGISNNSLAVISGLTPSTVYSMMDERRRDLSILTIKKICDGLDMSLTEFFSDPIFSSLEQEIR